MRSFRSLSRRLRKTAAALIASATMVAGTAAAQEPEQVYPSPQPGELASGSVIEWRTVPGQPRPVPVDTPMITAPATPGANPSAGSPGQPAAPATPSGPKWITPLPKPGYFFVQPTGPGYYTLLDQIRGNVRETPPKHPHPKMSPFIFPSYDLNWAYLRDPNNTEHDYADSLKWIPIADGVTFTTGGELRYRFMNEVNSNGRLSGATDAYSMWRARTYGDLWVNDWLRVFGEFMYSDVTARSLPPLPTDIDRGDILNLFADVRVLKFGEKDNPLYFRVGRQEMLYGSERLISPLDWVGSRRTFQGFKFFTHTDKWDFDAFAVQPVVPNAARFDSVDDKQWFSGAWFTYRPKAGQNIDMYYLNLNNARTTAATGQYGAKGSFNVSTFGSRYVGTANNWLWDAEVMVQTGRWSNQSILANSWVASGGYHFKDLRWQPQLWVGYDHASGDPDPGNTGTHRTFNQLFPFGHPYYGFTDMIGRQNIHDFYLQGVAFPEMWLTLIAQYHVFRLDSDKDAMYNPGGAIVRQDPTGRSGNDIGNEVDLVVNFHVSHHSDLFVGYSRLFAGRFITSAPVPAQRSDPELFYMQYSYRW